jgi:NADP-dependent 3-hydroxy acid dehydrogenase YdfG
MIEFDLSGRAGVVTGAGKGIGAAVAAELARLGAQLVICARTKTDIDDVVARISDAGGEATGIVADVRRYEDMVRLAESCMADYGKIDFAVPNAGVVVIGNMSEGDPDDWRRLVETNLLGTAYTVRATLPFMKERGRGHVVIVSSTSGRVTYTGEPMYVASKWALAGLGGCLRKEALEYGVRVTLIEPGLVDTPMIWASEEGRAELAKIQAITPEDCANAVAFALCQPPIVNITQLGVLSIQQDYCS